MLFRNLFIATLAALAFVGCSDDKDIIEPIPDGIGDVNVVFATTSSEQTQTKAETGLTTTVYENFVPTESVKEYCLKTKIEDPEFVIDHLTVFVFDNNGGLVKTAYFKDQQEETAGMNIPSAGEDANSISEFGGIVLKEGTYKFILAGNLTKDQITVGGGETDFERYKAATINWTGKTGISTEIENTCLPMIKVLEGIKLIAHKKTATATLNLIGGDATVVAPSAADDKSKISVVSAIQLTRLVARVQLKSLKFNWSVKDENGNEVTQNPAASITLKKVYLANASNTSVLSGANEGSGYVHGFDLGYDSELTDMYIPNGTADEDHLSKVSKADAIVNGNEEGITWTNDNVSNDTEGTAILPLSFYAFGKTIANVEDEAQNPNLMLVLECSAAYNTGEAVPGKSVYYYVPVSNNNISSIEPNKVYNVNVTLIGQGSDDLGKKQDKEVVSVGLSVGDWNNGEPIEFDPNPTPVPSK